MAPLINVRIKAQTIIHICTEYYGAQQAAYAVRKKDAASATHSYWDIFSRYYRSRELPNFTSGSSSEKLQKA